MLTLYFSGTGNSAYAAKLFSNKINAKCLSIEDDANFSAEIFAHDTIAFCYPIYGSRVPMIMRQFAVRHAPELQGKKIIIFATQMAFSGDGARVFTDLFPKGHFDVIYADHLKMPNNMCNFILQQPSNRSIKRRKEATEHKMNRICSNINNKIIKRRGFSVFARFMGSLQGKPWQGNSSTPDATEGTLESRSKTALKISDDCDVCGLCANVCPMKNLEIISNKIAYKNNCTICYRCVNLCPKQAITVFFHNKPKWQYKGIG